MTEEIANELIRKRRRLTSDGVPDADIVVCVLSGDAALYEVLMRRYNRLLFRLARSIVGDDDEARDVVQAAYVRAYYHLDQFRGPAGFASWLSRITINEACARVRRAHWVTDDDRIPRVAAGSSADPENAAITGEALHMFQLAIDRLPDEFRSVFMLRGVEELSVAETAELLDIKPATVKTRFHRARLLLQASLHRRFARISHEAFPFAGVHCDGIVATVFARIQSGSNRDTGGVICFPHGSLS